MLLFFIPPTRLHSAKWIVKECLQGDLVRGRTVILAVSISVPLFFLRQPLIYPQTHNLPLIAPIAEFFVAVDINGIAKEAGTTLSSVLELDSRLKAEVEEQEIPEEIVEEMAEEVLNDESKNEAPKPQGKLILSEEINHGHIAWKSYMLYLRGFGGSHPYLFATFWLGILFLVRFSQTFSVWFLGYWSSQYGSHPAEEINIWL